MENIYREGKDGNLIRGVGLPAFIHNTRYHLVTIKIYEDGIIDCWRHTDFEGFIEKVRSGWVVTSVPAGSEICRHHSFFGTSTDINTYIDEEEFIKEVKDILDSFKGRKTSSGRCRDSFTRFLLKPTQDNKAALKRDYELVPKHLKKYVLGDMDVKDEPIGYILSNNEWDQERLEHFKQRFIEL